MLFTAELVSLPLREVWSMHDAGTRCPVWGDGAKGQRKFFV